MSAVLAFSLWVAAAPALGGSEAPVFARPEPHLKDGSDKLRAGDAEGALEAFRKAGAATANERAIVEYDVGQALVLKAQTDAQAAPQAEGGPPKIDVADARAAFDRAFGLALDPGLKSEASLASGNAAALGGDLDGAIGAFRKALVADPRNERAKKNLLRVLAAKKAQPPPPPQEGGDGDKNDDKKDEEKKDEDKKDEEEKKGDKSEEEKKGEEPGDKKEEEKKQEDEKKKDEKDEKKDGEEKDDKKEEPGQAEPKPTPKQQKKEEARKLLDALRSREKPLSPMEMRGTTRSRPKAGKDW